ncbi:hypothetical protein [Chitinimonas lacunae]|uniref:Uncharacterized protein n=1 Tax=Chitinimonas lacunae TaxID=1963018 RepID=A0ABV8ML26_9NEIS
MLTIFDMASGSLEAPRSAPAQAAQVNCPERAVPVVQPRLLTVDEAMAAERLRLPPRGQYHR